MGVPNISPGLGVVTPGSASVNPNLFCNVSRPGVVPLLADACASFAINPTWSIDIRCGTGAAAFAPPDTSAAHALLLSLATLLLCSLAVLLIQ
jgi:hypothetical protein